MASLSFKSQPDLYSSMFLCMTASQKDLGQDFGKQTQNIWLSKHPVIFQISETWEGYMGKPLSGHWLDNFTLYLTSSTYNHSGFHNLKTLLLWCYIHILCWSFSLLSGLNLTENTSINEKPAELGKEQDDGVAYVLNLRKVSGPIIPPLPYSTMPMWRIP